MKLINPSLVFNSRLLQVLPGVYYHLKFDSGWRIIAVSEQTLSLLGYPQEEALMLSWDFLKGVIHPEDFTLVSERKNEVFIEGKLFDIEYRVITRNGEIKFVRDQYTCYLNVANEWIMEGYLSEVVQSGFRDRLLQQLKAYRDAVNASMISSITDKTGKITFVNENFIQVSKYPIHELIGQNHRIVNSGYHSKEFFRDLWKTISGGHIWQGEILNKAKDGTLYWVYTVILPILDEQKSTASYLSLRTLINERKEAEQQRKKHMHLLEQIAFIVAHNIRGPLCSIMGLVDLLSNYKNTAGEVTQILGYLKNSAGELNTITDQLSHLVYENEIEMKLVDEK